MKRFLLAALTLTVAAPASAQLAPHNAAGITYGHVHINVKDIEAQKKFWVDQFGATIVTKGPLTVAKMPSLLVALQQREPSGPSQGTVMDHFGFKVKDIQAFLTKWRAAGYAVNREFTGAEGFPNAYITGPDNVYVELQEDKNLAVPIAGYHIHFMKQGDLAALRDWYVNMFSLVPKSRGTIPVTADAPGMNLSFGASQAATVGTRGRGIDHIGFEVRNLEAFCKQLEAKGIKFDVPFRAVPSIGLNIAYLTDPSGVYIELTEGYDKY
jgi:catechol 2,3-dioxygenase-like lactoylglutathione lyase family enzyme